MSGTEPPSWLCHECGSQASQSRCLLASIRRGAALFAPQKASTHLRLFTGSFDRFYACLFCLATMSGRTSLVALPRMWCGHEAKAGELAHLSRAEVHCRRQCIHSSPSLHGFFCKYSLMLFSSVPQNRPRAQQVKHRFQ